jgi:Tol biopolymer transport system component
MVTNNTSTSLVYDNPAPSLNAKFIVVESNADPTGGNADGNYEIFLYNTHTKEWQQITDTTAPVDNHRPFTIDGKWILFDSNADFVGSNADHNRELYMARLRSSGVSFTQITDTAYPVENLSGSMDGHSVVIAFSSNGDLIPGGNPDGNSEIFVWLRRAKTFEQLTNSAPPGENAHPSINLGQRFVVFESTADLTNSGAGNRRIFQFDRVHKTLTLLSRSRFGTNQLPKVSLHRYVIWESNANLTGHNPNGDWVIYLFDRRKD